MLTSQHVVEAGGTCVMVIINSVGYMGVTRSAAPCQLRTTSPQRMGHDDTLPALGVEFAAWQRSGA